MLTKPSSGPSALTQTMHFPFHRRATLKILSVTLTLQSLFGMEPPSIQPAAPSIWEPLASLPSGRAGFASSSSETHLVIAGGTRWENDVKLTLLDCLQYDLTSHSWSVAPPLPRAFAYGVDIASSGAWLLLGGDDGESTRADGMWVPSEGTPNPHRTLSQPVALAGSTTLAGRLYVVGGTDDFRKLERATAQFFSLDAKSGLIRELPNVPGGPRILPAVAAFDGQVVAITGARIGVGTAEVENLTDAWCYSTVNEKWSAIAAYPFPVRGLTACTLNSRYVLLAGGFRTSLVSSVPSAFTDNCFLYDAKDNRYLPLPPLPYSAMLGGLVRQGEFLYIVGGEDRQRHRSALVYRTTVAKLFAAAGIATQP